jgi:hypothetical protein
MPISQIPGFMLGNSQLIPGAAANVGVAIVENPTTISVNYCVSTGSNAHSVGPITIASGYNVTVPVGSVWSIT